MYNALRKEQERPEERSREQQQPLARDQKPKTKTNQRDRRSERPTATAQEARKNGSRKKNEKRETKPLSFCFRFSPVIFPGCVLNKIRKEAIYNIQNINIYKRVTVES